MLREECVGCPNVDVCGFLAARACASCDRALICPAEQLVKGFFNCPTPTESFGKLTGVCQLKRKFSVFEEIQIGGNELPKAVATLRCCRCASSARVMPFYNARTGEEDDNGIFGEVSLKKRTQAVCSRCGLRDVDPLPTPETLGRKVVAVFHLDQPTPEELAAAAQKAAESGISV